jgi:hypothetical protein
MSLSKDEKNDIKAMVLIELENMFTGITNKHNTPENHEMMLFLMDIENRVKQTLMEIDS